MITKVPVDETKEIEGMFKNFIEAMNQRFHQDRPIREGNKATNDSLVSS